MTLWLVEATIFVVAAALVLRVVAKPPFRRDAAAFPALAAIVVVTGLIISGVGIWGVACWPLMRHVTAVVTAAAIAFAWWRARPSYGVSRGLPPGSLGVGQSLDGIDDRTYYLDLARAHGPIFKTSQFGRPVVCVMGLARGRELLARYPEALAAATLPYNRRLPRGTLRYMSDREHRDEAPLFRTTFASLALDAGEPQIREACRATLGRIVADSQRSQNGVRPREYFADWLLLALARIFFGMSPTDSRISDIDRAMRDLRLHRAGGMLWQRKLESALVRITALMQDVAREGAETGSALRVFLDTAPDGLNDPTRARNLFLAFRISHGDLTGLADWLFSMLTTNTEWQAKVRTAGRTMGSPNGAQPSDLGTRVVLETLRMEQSEYLYRRVAERVRIGDYDIPEGWLLRICVNESHRDPDVFAEPNKFDPDRFADRTFSRSEYSPFGADTRGCMGARITHFLGRILVEELCAGFEWRLTRAGPPEHGSRQRDHWRPSSETLAMMRTR